MLKMVLFKSPQKSYKFYHIFEDRHSV